MLNNLLSKYKFHFDGTLGTLKTKLLGTELQPYDIPHHSKLYPDGSI